MLNQDCDNFGEKYLQDHKRTPDAFLSSKIGSWEQILICSTNLIKQSVADPIHPINGVPCAFTPPCFPPSLRFEMDSTLFLFVFPRFSTRRGGGGKAYGTPLMPSWTRGRSRVGLADLASTPCRLLPQQSPLGLGSLTTKPRVTCSMRNKGKS